MAAEDEKTLSSAMLRRVTLVTIDVSEENIVSIITVSRFGELGTTFSQRFSLASYC
jgi:hypothetical protein